MKQLSAIIIGSGDRGRSYASQMAKLPEQYRIVGAADPVRPLLVELMEKYGVPEDACYASWEEILAQPKMADLAIISTMDDMHYEPAMQAIELGYHILLEKPVAQTAKECVDIALAAEKKGVKVLVGHVLRYTPFFNKIKTLLMEDTIGKPVSVVHVEAVGNVHQSHSFVRGN